MEISKPCQCQKYDFQETYIESCPFHKKQFWLVSNTVLSLHWCHYVGHFFNLTSFCSCFKLPTSSKPVIYSLIYSEVVLGDWNGMRVVLALMLQLVQLCIIGFAVTAQESKGKCLLNL